MNPKDYVKLIGHSEQFVRNWCMPVVFRNDVNAQIELRVSTNDILANCNKLSIIGSNERGANHGHS